MEDSSSSSCSSSSASDQASDCNIQDCGPAKCKPKKKPSCKPKKKPSCGSSKGKCAKPGKVTRNPFLNFLRDFRLKNCGKTMVKISIEAGCVWKKMSDCDKEKYRKMACAAPKSHRRKKKGKCGRRRSY